MAAAAAEDRVTRRTTAERRAMERRASELAQYLDLAQHPCLRKAERDYYDARATAFRAELEDLRERLARGAA